MLVILGEYLKVKILTQKSVSIHLYVIDAHTIKHVSIGHDLTVDGDPDIRSFHRIQPHGTVIGSLVLYVVFSRLVCDIRTGSYRDNVLNDNLLSYIPFLDRHKEHNMVVAVTGEAQLIKAITVMPYIELLGNLTTAARVCAGGEDNAIADHGLQLLLLAPTHVLAGIGITSFGNNFGIGSRNFHRKVLCLQGDRETCIVREHNSALTID